MKKRELHNFFLNVLTVAFLIFILSAAICLALSFLASNFYKSIAPFSSSVVKYSLIVSGISFALAFITHETKSTKSQRYNKNSYSNFNPLDANSRELKQNKVEQDENKVVQQILDEISNEEKMKHIESENAKQLAKENYEAKKLAENEKRKDKASFFHIGVHCPYCRSLDVQFMQNNRKGFSVSKAVTGTALTGGVGSLAGFMGKKGKKNQWRCNNCGKTFTSKK